MGLTLDFNQNSILGEMLNAPDPLYMQAPAVRQTLKTATEASTSASVGVDAVIK